MRRRPPIGGLFVVYAALVTERPISASPLRVVFGPGLILGLKPSNRSSRFTPGIYADVGVDFDRGRYEVFLHAMPQMVVDPRLTAALRGGIGLRYFF